MSNFSKNRLVSFVLDAIALNLFIVVTAFFVEVVFSRIAFGIFFWGRVLMIVPNTVTVVPYNRTRQWFSGRVKVSRPRLKKLIADTLTFVLFRVPLVFVVLTVLGNPVHKTITACIVATLISTVSGRPFGAFLDWWRKSLNYQGK